MGFVALNTQSSHTLPVSPPGGLTIVQCGQLDVNGAGIRKCVHLVMEENLSPLWHFQQVKQVLIGPLTQQRLRSRYLICSLKTMLVDSYLRKTQVQFQVIGGPFAYVCDFTV